MKITALLLLIGCMHISAASLSQTVTLAVKAKPLTNVFETIEEQTGYQVLYSDRLVNSAKPISISVDGMPLEDFLKQILTPRFLTYSIADNNILIKALEKAAPKPAGPAKALPGIQQRTVTGRVTDEKGNALADVTIKVKNGQMTTISGKDGGYRIRLSPNADVLVFSIVGYESNEVKIGSQSMINTVLKESISDLDEVVVVGYGTQKKRDITGSIASIPPERLQNVPNTNITQAIQGAISGVFVSNSTAGAAPGNSNTSIMIRGRNSITASNSPLIVVDGISYAGELRDINVNDIQSVEILKDASAAAIYGSRGANGVILITTKGGLTGGPKFNYSGYYSLQKYTNLPDLLNGEEFYQFKMDRNPTAMTPSEQRIYDAKEWVDWFDLAFRTGENLEQDLSVTGTLNSTQYYISGGYNNIKGLAINDNYKRLTGRINFETKVADWLTVGTKNQYTYDDRGGVSPTLSGDNGVFQFDPLTKPYDENGKLTIYPFEEETALANPLMGLLAEDLFETNQLISNNYAVVDFPFIKGLQYRLNTGLRMRFARSATYYGRDTRTGLLSLGSASTNRTQYNNTVIENLLNYTREFGKHQLFVNAGYNYEGYKSTGDGLSARGFPNDFLTWYGAAQAEFVTPSYDYDATTLISQMFRLNYSYNSRYLLTLTGRRDGYSGFGSETKWGFFPSVAFGWNVTEEDFFKDNHVFDRLKMRVSWGRNGNQAVGAYQTISSMDPSDIVNGSTTMPGYKPSKLGQDELGWETTGTLNVGLDFSVLKGRVAGDINLYRAHTTGLLLNRSISPVHGLTSITQNIGETENKGIELNITSSNIVTNHFSWKTTANWSFIKNRIVSLYGFLDENGKERDDVANSWFIGRPITQIYGQKWIGVWQLDEAEQAAAYRTQPGFIKLQDTDGDGHITADDRTFLGQSDPNILWGLTNTFSYNQFTLNVFIQGVHGVTKNNTLLTDNVTETVRRNTIKKNWWTPENPTNDWYMNDDNAQLQDGQTGQPYENASFIRIKDISLAYAFSGKLLERLKINKLQVYVTGRNLFTITKFRGLDPELGGQQAVPIQKEFVFGASIQF